MPDTLPADRAGQIRAARAAIVSANSAAADDLVVEDEGASAVLFTVLGTRDRVQAERRSGDAFRALVDVGFFDGLACGVVPHRDPVTDAWDWSYYALVPVASR